MPDNNRIALAAERVNDHLRVIGGTRIDLLTEQIRRYNTVTTQLELVLYYAVSVLMSFLVGLLAMARFSRREHGYGSLALNAFGALVVAFTVAVNLARGHPIISVAAVLLIGLGLHRLWSRAGRPRGIASVLVEDHERAD